MRPVTSLLQVALCLSSVTPVLAAWPRFLPHPDTLVVRDNADAAPAAVPTDASATATDGSSSSAPSKTASSGSSASSASSASSQSSKPSKTGTGTQSNSGTTGTADPDSTATDSGDDDESTATDDGDDSSPTHTTFDIIDPAAGVLMRTPNTAVPTGPALFKIGDYITLGWNYTNMQATPTAIDVLITCSSSKSLWTLTQNMTFQTSAAFIWDTSEQANSVDKPLLTAQYQLLIKNSDVGINSKPEPGYLGTFAGFQFSLYAKQKYVPFPEFHCLDCGSGSGGFDSGAIRLAAAMCVVTVFSFTWFVSGLGLH